MASRNSGLKGKDTAAGSFSSGVVVLAANVAADGEARNWGSLCFWLSADWYLSLDDPGRDRVSDVNGSWGFGFLVLESVSGLFERLIGLQSSKDPVILSSDVDATVACLRLRVEFQ
ncbi:hypothetical protein IEQ34_020246 [Dendrobium chrysotoxum]|uniref:Uncharacterized protein n=1 Tax=Dendrobium chrysotoxum TaxID=161865 RepID=A0AAV7G1W0_DENCH|nr:hypothetical protein IEQ34_020246 [Dendrobium chrysotoxum]